MIKIESSTFRECTSLVSITIPNSVTKIWGNAFYSCDALTTVYYSGAPADWANITVRSNNEPLLNAEIFYYGDTIKLDESQIIYTGNTCTYEFAMKSKDLVEGKFVVALYNGDTFVGCATETLSDTTETEYSTSGEITTASKPNNYKVFFVSDLVKLTPLCRYAEGEIQIISSGGSSGGGGGSGGSSGSNV